MGSDIDIGVNAEDRAAISGGSSCVLADSWCIAARTSYAVPSMTLDETEGRVLSDVLDAGAPTRSRRLLEKLLGTFVGPRSVLEVGCNAVFDALKASFQAAAALGDVVMTATISNCCPMSVAGQDDR